MVIKNLCVLVLWTKVASALEGLMLDKRYLLHLAITESVISLSIHVAMNWKI